MTGVLVVGSLHYDVMIAAPALPRLGETLTGSAWAPKFGGKGGNQARAAATAGAPTRMLGAVGRDGFGAFLHAGLRAGGVEDRVRDVDAGSGISVAITEAAGDYGAVIVSGANLAIRPEWLDDPGLWDGVAVLLLQNEIPEPVNLAAARAARRRGVEVSLNAAPFRPSSPELLATLDVLLVNALEAEALGAGPVATLAEAAWAAARLGGLAPVVVITAGAAGVAAAGRDGSTAALPAEAVGVVSTHGAGDVFAGTLGASRAGGASLAAGLAAANRAAAGHVAVGGGLAPDARAR